MKRLILLPMLLFAALLVSGGEPVRVACIGNSITYGYLLDDPATQSYPAQLQQLLGDGYKVGNFGRSGATLLRHGHRPYTAQPEWRNTIDFRPDIAVIHLGVNDTDPRNWPHYGDEFITDYLALTDTLRQVNPEVRIIIANLTPIGAQHYRFRSGTRQWRDEIRQTIRQVALGAGAELIDFDDPLRHRQNLMPDGIHPDKEGAGLLARTVKQAITGDYGGLRLPAIYQNGMVLQRDRYLPISGTADAAGRITVTLDGHTYKTVADNRGRWRVTAAPLLAGGPYEMTVSDGKRTLHFTDILAGEVWIASGQSNMEFPLRDATGSETDIAVCNDPQLRFYDMKPIARTNDEEWPDSIIEATDRLGYFKKTSWTAVNPRTAPDLSAVAYYFARQLRDSLHVPVGVISNAVGGAPCESWIDVTTLERGMPEILINWRTNDYVQPWAQGRAAVNTGAAHPRSRHPYEPSYLFAAGIEPLGHYAVKGLIWYQGESNAHNPGIHEQLFPMLAESWRTRFDDAEMPIVYAQLSSINRPSWPLFRDSQRRLQDKVAHAYMAVTSDIGDSLDVHPRNKRPVGERMARQALHNIYGFSAVTPAGPDPLAAHRCGKSITVSFANADTLMAADGGSIFSFEVAAADGIFRPATATVTKRNEITLTNMDTPCPRYVRYGWQPFTRANLVNGEGLPATTFRLEAAEADNMPESGIECGVSAPFAALLPDGRILTAGGCNFPSDPMAAGSRKKFYRGIYAADTATMEWRRIGSLPEATAYGATAVTPKGIALIGGTPDGIPTSDVLLLDVDGESTATCSLPSLPLPLDNMACAAIGNRIYVAGGNAGGIPSADLYMLDLDNPETGWKRLRRMPGHPRVQPVMAAAESADGEMNLYVWGGFAPRHAGHEPTLELDGLRYSPSKDKWTAIGGPSDAEGNPLSVGGGSACTLSDGRIAVSGGVNKDIFLEALRDQAPDYLRHPAEWYRFNPNILTFNPTTGQWSIEETTQHAARAGAVMVAGSDHDLYIMGGEIKPRIRTSEILHLNEICHH